MSTGDSGPGTREVAYRLFAAEFNDCSLSYAESDDERAPNFVVTPTGLRVNRLFSVGVLTETEAVNDETLRGRIVDPTGAFVTYAGQYQPEAQAFLDRTTPPAFVAITGKARTFEPDDSDRVFTSIRPESLSEVEAATRDRWVVSAAESTLRRIAICAAAVESSLTGEDLQRALADAGVDESLAAGIPRAIEHYGTTTGYLAALRQLAVDALEVVADEREEVRPLDVAPGEASEASIGPLPSVALDLDALQTAPQSTPEASTTGVEPDLKTATQTADAVDTASTDTDPTTTSTDSEPADTSEPTDAEPPEKTLADSPTADDTTDATGSVVDTTTDADSTAPATGTEPEPEKEPTTDEPAEAGLYQLDDAEREELESEFGSEFSSGNEIDPAGEAGIDVPDVDELAEKAEADKPATAEASEPEIADTDDSETLGEFEDELGSFEDTETSVSDSSAELAAADDEHAESDSEAASTVEETDDVAEASPTEDVDLESAVVKLMAKLDDGDGVDRAVLRAEVVDTYGVDEKAIEEAIADALMGGRCYEPSDDTLKAI